MRNRSKFLGIIAILTIIGLLFAGCGGSGGDSTTPGGTDDPNTPGGSGGSGGGGGGSYVGGGSKPSTVPQETANAVTGVAFTQDSINLIVSDTTTVGISLSVTGTPSQLVAYNSSDVAVATVSDAGLITAVAAGTATVTVTSVADISKKDTLTVNVLTSKVGKEVTGITLDKTDVIRLTAGQKLPVKVTFEPADAAQQGITWTSGASGVATIVNGILTAVGAGTTTITATAVDNTNSATATFDVLVSAAAPTGVTITKTGDDLIVWDLDSPAAFAATVQPAGAVQDVVWTSATPGVAEIGTTTGAITLKGTGTTVITATTVAEPIKTATATFTVNRKPTGITITITDPESGSLPSPFNAESDPVQLAAEVAPATATGNYAAVAQTVTWLSSDDEIATVSATGLVTPVGIKAGAVTITAKSTVLDTVLNTQNITLDAIEVETIEVPATYAISGAIGDEFDLPEPVVFDPDNATDLTYAWTVPGADATKLSVTLGSPPKLKIGADATTGTTVTITCTATDNSNSAADTCVVTITIPTP